MSMAERIGKVIAAGRGTMSMAELSRRTGISRQHLHRYVSGDAVPRADHFMRLCSELSLDPWAAMDTSATTGDQAPTMTINELFGGADDPTETQLPSGIYDGYIGGLSDPDMVLRFATIYAGGPEGRWTLARLPREVFPEGTPRTFRTMMGPVLIKFDQTIVIVVFSQVVDHSERQLSISMLAPRDFRNGSRSGVTVLLNHSAGALPMITKVVVIRSREKTFARAYRKSGVIPLGQAPDFVQSYFRAHSGTPYIMRSALSASTTARVPEGGRYPKPATTADS